MLSRAIMLLLLAGERAMSVTTMTMTTEKHRSHNGFATPLEGDTDLGLALLIVEDEDGRYEPVANVATINEAKELAADDFRRRH